MIFLIFLIIILIIIIWGFITDWNFVSFKNTDYYKKEKGICFFDIDGTLIDAIDDIDDIVQKCLDNNYGVGIITASGRTPKHLIKNNNKIESWVGEKLWNYMKDNNFITYNSATPILAGKKEFPEDYPAPYPKNSQGFCKGYAMMYYSKIKNIKPENIILFDDQRQVVNDVKKFNPKLGAVLVDCKAAHCKDGRNYPKLSVSIVDEWFKSK